eukprot:TRINITY_DN10267_c0_g1_i1.p1 TRINITY_DN10267_c0_g1~~TRINITY_DN10267_c0_g1_i1.p1  ORF type:complete len:684 (-),score=103.61 TRINITY_DN10267_c0_g1_i1:264-2132(-)
MDKSAKLADNYRIHHLPLLYGLLKDPDGTVKDAALRCIAKILNETMYILRKPWRRDQILPELRENADLIATFVESNDPYVVEDMITILLYGLEKESAKYNTVFVQCLSHENRRVQGAARNAVRQLEELGKQDPSIQKMMDEAKAQAAAGATSDLTSQDPAKRRIAVQTLGNMGKGKVAEFKEQLAKMLDDKEVEVQGKTCEVLGMLGEEAAPYVDRFLSLFKDNSKPLNVRGQALEAIRSVGPKAATEPVLAEMKKAFLGDLTVAGWLVQTLKALGDSGIAIAVDALEDPKTDQPHQLLCLKALIGTSSKYGKVIETYFLKGDLPNDQTLVCLEAFGEMGSDYGKMIETHLQKRDAPTDQKLVCVKNLGKIGTPYGRAIGEYLNDSSTPTDHKVECLKQLGGQSLKGDRDSNEIIAKSLADSSEDVVQAALSALNETGNGRNYNQELKACYMKDPKKREMAYKILKDVGIDLHEDPDVREAAWKDVFGSSGIKGVMRKEGQSYEHEDTLFVDSSGNLKMKYSGDELLSISGSLCRWRNSRGQFPNGDDEWLWESNYLRPRSDEDREKWNYYLSSGSSIKNEGSAGGGSWNKYGDTWSNGSTKWVIEGEMPEQYVIMICVGLA